MHYAKTKREKSGNCNICMEEKPLSWDHVPPKGGIDLTAVEVETVFQVFAGDPAKRQLHESQNGVKYRTICKECNSLLGLKYDPVINDFSVSVGRYIKSNLKFPHLINHPTRPSALMRGILGHLVAAKAEFEQVSFDLQVREYFFDETKPVPAGIYIYYWLYPYTNIVVMRDFCMPAVRGNYGDFGVFHTLKYFPVAYLVTDKPRYEGLLELTQYRNLALDEEVEIPIQLNRVEPPLWPEMIDKGNLLLAGQSIASSILARPRGRKVVRTIDKPRKS